MKKLQGRPYKNYYKNGQIKQEGFILNGKKNGRYKHYSFTGLLGETGIFVDNEKQGEYEHYEKGILMEKGFLNNGEIVGAHEWYHENGIISLKGNMLLGGIAEGWFEYFDSEGDLVERVMYKNGEKHGLYKLYNKGFLLEEGSFKHGNRFGTTMEYYNDDNPHPFL